MAADAAPIVMDLQAQHWSAVAQIYTEGLATGDASFETEAPNWEQWDASHLREHRLVAHRDGRLLGWAAASAISDRCANTGVVESSVYVAESARGQRVGRLLLAALIQSTEAAGIWTVQAGIFPENKASLRLHARVGFEIVGLRRRIGRLAGVWRDVLLLERRSDVVG